LAYFLCNYRVKLTLKYNTRPFCILKKTKKLRV
jgi:hypothetical protein